MTINPCKHHPDAKGDDAPRRYVATQKPYHGTGCPLCRAVPNTRWIVSGNADKWNAANPLPEVKP